MYEPVFMPDPSTRGHCFNNSVYDKTEEPAQDGITEMMMVK